MASDWDVATRTRLLASVRLFHELPADLQREVAAGFAPRLVPRGSFVFLEGQPADQFNLLAEGRIKVVRETPDGREVILRLIQPGEIFGGAGSWGQSHYPASAVAQEDAVVLEMAAGTFTDWLRRRPEFAMALIRELSTRLREAEARIGSLQTERVERRVARLLLYLSQKDRARALTLSREEVANLTGTTLSTASRILSAWEQQGLVRSGRARIEVLSPDRLNLIASEE